MKVAIIIERTDIALGGAERSVFELRNQLVAEGLEVDIIAAGGQKTSSHIHILGKNKPGKRTSLKRFGKAIKEHLAENHYDIIHSVLPFDFADVYQPRGGTYAETITRSAASYQNRLLAFYKKLTSFANFRRNKMLRAEKRLCKNPDGPVVLALSEYVKEQFKKHYNLEDNRIAVITNGVKTTISPDMKQADKLRAQILGRFKLKEADEPILLLFAANNFRLKGLSALIKAMAIVNKQKTKRPIYLIVAGSGRPHKYRYIAARLGIAKKIILLGKLRHIQNALAVTDVAVLPTWYDPCSRFILEALAASNPVITTRFNGAIDLFEDNRHGRIIDSPENITALAEAISYFANTENIKLAREAILNDNIKQAVSINRHCEQLIEEYKAIIQRKGL